MRDSQFDLMRVSVHDALSWAQPRSFVRALFHFVLAALYVKTFGAVLYEYRWYFPLNFEASRFLFGREDIFVGSYPAAFYTHLVSGPVALALTTYLMFSGPHKSQRSWHRLAGRWQLFFVTLLSISGAVMAKHAIAGPVAGAGLLCLAVLTLGSSLAAAYFAATRRFSLHRAWATRSFLLLCSPLLLRIVGGVLMVSGIDEVWYRWNVWLSWLTPMLLYEATQRWPVAASRRENSN